jgi:hypothetical protein
VKVKRLRYEYKGEWYSFKLDDLTIPMKVGEDLLIHIIDAFKTHEKGRTILKELKIL